MQLSVGACVLPYSSVRFGELFVVDGGRLSTAQRHRHGRWMQQVSSTKRRLRGAGMVCRWRCRGGGEAYLERAIGAVSYVLPLLDGMQYGRFVFAQYPATEAFFRPLFPLLRIYASIPFSNFVLFFAIYLGLVRNPRFGRFVRFNAMQACVLDVLIILPLVAQRIFSPRSGLGLDLLVVLYNTIFIALLAAVVFAVVSCVLGKTPRLPFAADAADNQLF